MDKAVLLVWSRAAVLGGCVMMLGMKQAPPSHPGTGDLSPAYSETNCACSGFSCGGVEYAPCSSVCSGPKHASCTQGTCSGPYGFESATPNVCKCE
jgi:hypothetical protein